MPPEHHSSLFQPGRNCWRREHADKVAFLIDADAYFRALRQAIIEAQRSVFIIGWDIDSRLRLLGNGDQDSYPAPLAEFLDAVARQRRKLKIFILTWDFAMIYAADREWLPIYRLDWKTHRHVYFRMDGNHPPGASHHQKLVVIDDALAFAGGLDLTKRRWDTPRHDPVEPARIGSDDVRYGPFHDVQMMVSGAAAAALGELARQRWERATGHLPRVRNHGAVRQRWPSSVAVDLEHGEIGIARTEPKYADQAEVVEVKQLYLDAIADARETIYLENQYFTSHDVGDALAARLQQPDCPEIVIVSTRHTDGWLSQHTMDVLRAKLVKRLRKLDRHGRFRAYFPHVPGLKDAVLNLHSKVMIVDDRFARVGSSNLNNRSMVLDTECDLALDANGSAAHAAAVALFRNRLLAEHLDVTPEAVAAAVERERSLIRGIESLRTSERSLQELADEAPEEMEMLPDNALLDPEWPISADTVVEHLLPSEEARPLRRRMIALGLMVIALVALAASWRWTPLGSWLNPEQVFAMIGKAGEVIGPVAGIGVIALASMVAVPLIILTLMSILTFGPLIGFVCSITGTCLGAAASYGLGRLLGRDMVRRLAGFRVNRLSRQLARHGILAVTSIRMLPIAPFAIVNMIAGASHIRLRDFLAGTALGLIPGFLAMTVFVDSIMGAVRNPGPGTVLVLLLVLSLIVSSAWALRRWLRLAGKDGS